MRRATATLALAALASAATAAPTPAARDTSSPPAGCTSLGKGPLGYDPSKIGIYASTPPRRYLGTWGNVDDSGAEVLQPGNTVPQDFELFSCKHTPAPYQGKGAIDAYDGYIASTTNAGQCLTASALNVFNAHFALKPCDFSSGGIADNQHFQFQTDSFYSYYLLDFLGKTPGPTPNATSSFLSNQGGYAYRLDTDDNFGSDAIALDYEPNSYVSSAEQMIAQVGNQYQAPKKTFPACRLRKTGAMSYKASSDAAARPVTVSPVPIVNGTQSFTQFQFYECDSDAMGYVSDPAAGTFYGHFSISSHDYCYVQQNGPEGPGNGLMFGNAYGGCSNNDDGSQAEAFFKYDANSGDVNFLGGAKSSNPQPYGWALADGKLNLAPGSTAGTFSFDK